MDSQRNGPSTSGEEFEILCTGYNKDGLTGRVGSTKVLVPPNGILLEPGLKPDDYVGKTIRLKPIDICIFKETLIYSYAFLPKDDDLWYNKVIKEGWIGK